MDLSLFNHPAVLVLSCMLIGIAVVAQWTLYSKAGQPGHSCIIPIWNLISFLKIVGRPSNHIWFFFIPIFNIYFTIKVLTELCDSFGKSSFIDYFLVIVFNGLYIFNLGLSHSAKYKGPVYATQHVDGPIKKDRNVSYTPKQKTPVQGSKYRRSAKNYR